MAVSIVMVAVLQQFVVIPEERYLAESSATVFAVPVTSATLVVTRERNKRGAWHHHACDDSAHAFPHGG
jgi:hypothetical protein